MNYVADNYAFSGLKGLIIIGIASLAMSTADSCINSAAVLFANDISKTLNIGINKLTISEGLPSGSEVGTLSATDNEAGTLTYSLVSGEGDTDNSSFTISG